MLVAEGSAWNYLRPILTGNGLDPRRIENAVAVGTPDINYVHGWIELKAFPKWPARGGPLRIKHFTQEQRIWLERRWRCGGLAWLLLRVEKDQAAGQPGMWMLFDGWTAFGGVEDSTREELLSLAAWSGGHLLNVIPWLKGEPRTVGERAMFARLKSRKRVSEIADDLGWPTFRVADAERNVTTKDPMDLLDYWHG